MRCRSHLSNQLAFAFVVQAPIKSVFLFQCHLKGTAYKSFISGSSVQQHRDMKFEFRMDSCFIGKVVPYTLIKPGPENGFDDLSF